MRTSRIRSSALALTLALGVPISVAGCGCPAALASGVLVAQGSTLALEITPGGEIYPVRWPFGYGVRAEGNEVVVTDLLGSIKAREGDTVSLPGGQSGDGGWAVCGELDVTKPAN